MSHGREKSLIAKMEKLMPFIQQSGRYLPGKRILVKYSNGCWYPGVIEKRIVADLDDLDDYNEKGTIPANYDPNGYNILCDDNERLTQVCHKNIALIAYREKVDHFKKGDPVECKFNSNMIWLPGVIDTKIGKDRYSVCFKNGEYEQSVHASYIKLAKIYHPHNTNYDSDSESCSCSSVSSRSSSRSSRSSYSSSSSSSYTENDNIRNKKDKQSRTGTSVSYSRTTATKQKKHVVFCPTPTSFIMSPQPNILSPVVPRVISSPMFSQPMAHPMTPVMIQSPIMSTPMLQQQQYIPMMNQMMNPIMQPQQQYMPKRIAPIKRTKSKKQSIQLAPIINPNYPQPIYANQFLPPTYPNYNNPYIIRRKSRY